jgi:hypothetical protein
MRIRLWILLFSSVTINMPIKKCLCLFLFQGTITSFFEDADADPGDPKTYGSGSGSGTLHLSIFNMHGHCDVIAGGEDNVPGNAAWIQSNRRGTV